MKTSILRGRVILYSFGFALCFQVANCGAPHPPVILTPTDPSEGPYDLRTDGAFPADPDVDPTLASGNYDAAQVAPPKEPRAWQKEVLQSPSAESGQGFCVQVYAGRSEESAIRIQQDIKKYVTAMPYVVYLGSYYKVWVGNCPTRTECEVTRKALRDAGYDTAWIAKNRINP